MTRLSARLRRSEEGFTLIELLVVVAIIALLATFAVPRLFDAINKSKGSVGDSDLQTLSAAVERWYFDQNSYETDTNADGTADAAEFETALKNGYVKANTDFTNGFGKGYMFFTDANGTYYIMVDPGNNAAGEMITLTCGPAAGAWTAAAGGTAVAEDMVYVTTATSPTSAQLNAGCSVAGVNTTFIDDFVKHVTN